MATSFQLPSFNLNEITNEFAQTLSKDMVECGFSYLGPKCLFAYRVLSGAESGIMYDPKGTPIYVVELRWNRWDQTIILAFEVSDRFELRPTVLRIFEVQGSMTFDQSIHEYLASSSVLQLSEIAIAPSFEVAVELKIQNPETLREFFHSVDQLAEGGVTPAQLRSLVGSTEKISQIIWESPLSYYQLETLWLLDTKVLLSYTDMAAISERLLNSQDQSVQQQAAVYVLRAFPDRSELRSIMSTVLKTGLYISTKVEAIEVLKRGQQSLEEQTLILSMLNSESGSVREVALEAAEEFRLSLGHLQAIEPLLNVETDHQVRFFAAHSLGKLPFQSSLDALKNRLPVETNEQVREQISRSILSLQECFSAGISSCQI